MAVFITFSFFVERDIFIGPSAMFFETLSTPQWKHLFRPPVAK
jgi:hypothetical protein